MVKIASGRGLVLSCFRVVGIAVIATFATACGGSDDAPPPSDPLRLPALHAEPDPVGGGRIVDAEGREVLLRGANVNALAEYWQGTDFPTTFPLTAADADTMAAIGWNTVRLLISWSRVEPAPGSYDSAYLTQARAAVRLLAERGIYSIVDLHQDAWGPTLVAAPDELCLPPSRPAFGWDGAPEWATLDGDQARCTTNDVRELSPAVVASFRAIWENSPGPGDIGIRTRYARMLGAVAAWFAHEPGVLGYDIMNEPNAFTPAHQQAMSSLYAEALVEIRAAEAHAGIAPRLALFEPTALWSSSGSGAPPDFARDRDVVYAPHIYTGGFTGGPITEHAFAVARQEAQRFGGAPVLSGEWGADPKRAGEEGDGYFLAHQEYQDEFRIGATLWTWRESCGDPHKAADYRDERTPYVWGEFDVDCNTNAVLGPRQALVDELTRAYVRAAPGRLVQTTYDPASGSFSASGTGATSGVELLAFYPTSLQGSPEVTGSGLADIEVIAAPGGNSYVIARATGGDWSLIAAP